MFGQLGSMGHYRSVPPGSRPPPPDRDSTLNYTSHLMDFTENLYFCAVASGVCVGQGILMGGGGVKER